MPKPHFLYSGLRTIARGTPLLSRLYRSISDLQGEVRQLRLLSEKSSEELTVAKAELAKSVTQEEELSRALAVKKLELSESNHREEVLSGELESSKADRALHVAREGDLSRELVAVRNDLAARTARTKDLVIELTSARAGLSASVDREQGLSRELVGTRGELAALAARTEDLIGKLTSTQAELSASVAREDDLSRKLVDTQAELQALAVRIEDLVRKLTSAQAELLASVAREDDLRRELASTKKELAVSIERGDIAKAGLAAATALSEELYDTAHAFGPSLRNQMTAQTDAILHRFEDARTSLLAQFPLLASHVMALRSGQEEAFRSLRSELSGAQNGAGSIARSLYLDLLEATLTGTIHPDSSQAPWGNGTYDPSRRALGLDWPSQAETMIGTARMRNLRMLAERALDENVPGDFIETGVWRGGACIYMRGILAAFGDKKRRVFVADSFRGLPPPNSTEYPADEGDQHHQMAPLAVSREEVETNFQRYGLLDDRVVFLEGWFKDTLPVAPIKRLALLRLDGDMYESTMDALNALYQKVSPGGFVIIDDYVLMACAKAVEDFRSRHNISAPLHEVDGAAVWWQVPK